MKTNFKRLFSLLMVLVMVCSMLPLTFAAGAAEPEDEVIVLTDEDYAIVNDVFAQIDAMEDAPAKKSANRTQITDAAAEIVMASENYVEGSLERNGNSFTWWTDEGIRCIYNPYMREKYDRMEAPADPESAGIYNEPKATKGGWPSGNQVYLIAPYYGIDDSFTDQYKNEAESIATAIGDTDGYTLYSGTSVTVDNVADAIENGAVVIFDSHGTTDYDGTYICDDPDGYEVYDYVSQANYSYICLTNKSGLTTADYDAGASYFTDSDGYMCACVNGAAIANHMEKNSPAGLLWMAICLGMATDTMCEPMRAKGVEVVYGYSQSVTFAGDYCFEETFWDNMIAGKDVATSIAAMKSKWGNWDWSEAIAANYGYSGSGYTLSEARQYRAAFPIVVSDEDAHPGQRDSGTNYGACSEQTVKSTYTLYSQYNVTAQSNNTAYGTVSVNGSTITATPATGYFAQGYTVTSGTATVTQNGNTFSVVAESDCTVQINFAAKTAITVNFSGANVSGQTGYAGDSMALPTAEAPEGYKFLGWTTAPLNGETTEKPSYYTDSFIPTGNTTLYALYSYVDSTAGGGSGDYVKVTETPDDWSGEYLIVYEDGSRVFDGSLSTLEAANNYKAVTISDSTISAEEADAYRFTIAAMDGGYSIQSVSGLYISGTSGSNKLNADATAAANTISIDASGNADIVSNTSHLRYNATSGQDRFRYYKSTSYSNQKAIALYVKDGSAGVTYYTSTLCDHENTTEVAAVAPTCTETGFTAGTQCTDCGSYVSGHEVVAALGHSWSDWTVTTEPGCETAGEQTRTCSVCGETETQAVAATGHNVGEGTVTTPATCTEAGVMTYTCATCGNATTEEIPATGHSYVDGACSACGEAEPQITGYYIAAIRSSGNYFYMTSDLGTGSTSRYQAVDSGLTVLPETIVSPEAGYVFNLIDNGDDTYSIQAVDVEGDNYLGHTSGNSGTLVDEASALKLTMTDNGDGTYSFSYAASDATRYLALNGTTGNNYFAWYKSGQKQALTLIPVGGTAEPDPSEPTEPEVTEPEVTEPEVTEPEETEPEETEPEVSEPAGSVTTLQYVFSDYTAGTQYAQGENHELDEVVTLTINGAHLNTQIRLYAGSNAVFTSSKEIDSIIVKAGNKAGTLNVYASADGSTWELVSAQATTTTYTNYSFDIPSGSYYVMLEAVGAQIRVSEMSIDVLEAGTTEPEPSEPSEPEVSEPEETEPEVSEPEVTEPVGSFATIDFSSTAQRTFFDTSAQIWANAGATLTNNKGSSTSNVADYSNPARFYKNSDIIIAFPGMTKIEVVCSSASYATTLVNSISDSNATVSADGQTVTIEFAEAVDEFSFTLTSGQVRVNELTVYGSEAEAECTHANTTTTTVDATCTAAGSVTVTCDDCGETISTEEIAATGHDYQNGVCANCGEADPNAGPAVAIKFASANMILEADLTFTFWVKPEVMAQYEDIRVEYVIGDKTLVVTESWLNSGNGRSGFNCTGIAPNMIKDTVQATIYGTYNGTEYSFSMEHSAYKYLTGNSVLGSADASLRTLAVDLLNYGTIHQLYTGYKTETLINADLTEEQKAYGTSTVPTLNNIASGTYETVTNPTAKFNSANLILENAVIMRWTLTCDDLTDVSVKIKVAGNEFVVDASEFEAVPGYTNRYYIYCSELTAVQFREPVDATIYQGDAAISNTLRYSVESYAASKQNDESIYYLADIVKAIMVYGDAAYAYIFG